MTHVEFSIGNDEARFQLRGIVLGKCADPECPRCDDSTWGFAIANPGDDLWAFIGDAPIANFEVAAAIGEAVLEDIPWFERVPYAVGLEWALIEQAPRTAYVAQIQPLGRERVEYLRRAPVATLRSAAFAARAVVSAPGRGEFMPGGGSVN